jgi:hypothetical protein
MKQTARRIIRTAKCWTLLLALPCLGCAASPQREVRDVLDAQVAAWNRGDIEGFMEGYWKSEELVFASTAAPTATQPAPATTETRGWQATLDRYLRRYPTSERMGRLAFTDLAVEPRDRERADVTGRYRVDRADGPLTGRFVLDFRRIDGRWVIVRDETISD